MAWAINSPELRPYQHLVSGKLKGSTGGSGKRPLVHAIIPGPLKGY